VNVVAAVATLYMKCELFNRVVVIFVGVISSARNNKYSLVGQTLPPDSPLQPPATQTIARTAFTTKTFHI